MLWICRDKDRTLSFFSEKPIKKENHWDGDKVLLLVPSVLFPEVRWDDEEPTLYSDDVYIKIFHHIPAPHELFNKRTSELENLDK